MGFIESLKRVLGHDQGKAPRDLARAWNLDDEPTEVAEVLENVGLYDRAQWHKKMKRILDELPASQPEWADLMVEASALHLDKDWVTQSQVDEFLLLIRRAVSDRHFTEREHRKLDLARDLIGIPEAEAEAALHSVVAEAESFFGGSVEGA